MIAVDDRHLYERWLENRDGDAFAELARRHSPVVYDLAVRASGDRALAEDLVQEALLDLALAGTTKPAEVGVVAWLVRFAVCRARNARSSERSRARRQRIVGQRTMDQRRREDVMPDNQLETHDELEHALSAAEPDERVVLAMRYLHGWDYARIADSLGISQGAARVRVHRALTAVRNSMGVDSESRTGGADRKLLAGIAVIPMAEMPRGLLDLAIENVLATAAATPAPSVASATSRLPRLPRLTLQVLGLASVLTLTAVIGLHDDATLQALDLRAGLFGTSTETASAAERVAPGVADEDAAWNRAVPRPPEWDDRTLSFVGAERRVSTPRAESVPAVDEQAAAPALDVPAPILEPTKVLRPTLRNALAARRVTVSSSDERAGTSILRASTMSRAVADAPARVEAPGLPESTDVFDTTPDRERVAPATATRLDELDAEQRELVEQAAALVLEIVDPAGLDDSGFDELVNDPRALHRRARALRKQYRKTRRKLRRAATHEDEVGLAAHAVQVRQVAAAARVLGLLFDVATADSLTAGDLLFPDGADLTTTLTDIVQVLNETVAAMPDGARRGPGLESTDGALPDGLLPDGLLPDGLMPDGNDG